MATKSHINSLFAVFMLHIIKQNSAHKMRSFVNQTFSCQLTVFRIRRRVFCAVLRDEEEEPDPFRQEDCQQALIHLNQCAVPQ